MNDWITKFMDKVLYHFTSQLLWFLYILFLHLTIPWPLEYLLSLFSLCCLPHFQLSLLPSFFFSSFAVYTGGNRCSLTSSDLRNHTGINYVVEFIEEQGYPESSLLLHPTRCHFISHSHLCCCRMQCFCLPLFSKPLIKTFFWLSDYIASCPSLHLFAFSKLSFFIFIFLIWTTLFSGSLKTTKHNGKRANPGTEKPEFCLSLDV